MKKVLIFYARYGGGHLSAANSLAEHIRRQLPGVEPVPVDFMAYLSKLIEKLTTAAYLEMMKKAPALWGITYQQSEKGPLAGLGVDSNWLMVHRLHTLIEEHQPDAILCTHPFASQLCARLKRDGLLPGVRLGTVLTDFAVHEQWLIGAEWVDCFFVAHRQMRRALIDRGVAPEKVFVTGIPIAEKFFQPCNKPQVRRDFGLEEGKFTILFFAGGMTGLCPENNLLILEDMVRYLHGVQVVVIAGKNPETFERLSEITRRYDRGSEVQVLGFTSRVAELMQVADLVITKPGGLTVSECLCCGLPMLLINPIPGQEEQNADYLEQNRLGLRIRREDTPIGLIFRVITSPELLAEMRQNLRPYVGVCAAGRICTIFFAQHSLTL